MKRILIICGVVLVLGIIILTCLFACGDKSGDKNTNTDKGKDTKTTSADISTSTAVTTTPTTPTTTKLTAPTTSPTKITTTITTITTITTTPTTTATTTPPTTTPPITTATTPKPTPTQPPKTEPPATEPPVTPYNQMDSGNAYLDTVMKDWFNSRGYYVEYSDFMVGNQRQISYASTDTKIIIGYLSFDKKSLTTDSISMNIGIASILIYNVGFGESGSSYNILYHKRFKDYSMPEDAMLEFQSNPDILLDYISPYL